MFKKILIANRGEIALRVIRTCRELGIQTVAVYSEADRLSLPVRFAEEAYLLGPAPARESYLDIDKILAVAKKAGVEAIHPGYGFLSENADFAERCQEEGIVFIGPSPKAMAASGDKLAARELAKKAKVPSVPGLLAVLQDAVEAKREAALMKYPVILKARAGGGGKGMRRVNRVEEMESAFRLASSEAAQSFRDGSLYMEKYIENPHHVELQILGDKKGNIICLGERECSVQRRHQKIIEESPSPFISEKTRQAMIKAAIQLGKAAGYYGAGTVECLVDKNQKFYFLEVNARLQVEHPVTEMVTGLDLVRAQIEIAAGGKLSEIVGANPRVRPSGKGRHMGLPLHGYAMECRIYAEDPDHDFLPSPGKITHLRNPEGPGVRVDSAVYPGCEISVYYDPMIAKLITWGRTRQEAIQRMRRALKEYEIIGIKTNISFHKRILEHPDFLKGRYDTGWIERNIFELKRERRQGLEEIAKIAVEIHQKTSLLKEERSEGAESRWKTISLQEGLR
ncbi:MAG: acetyl-CoA carboxylase biotin carboxylase subunit [Deltaproteobacteria bacterium]|nr:acetyl-CoA carboxylase biotin carboxylase subunit [Deltaproteobacteria bacterium]